MNLFLGKNLLRYFIFQSPAYAGFNMHLCGVQFVLIVTAPFPCLSPKLFNWSLKWPSGALS